MAEYEKMQYKQTASILVGICIVLGILGVLAAVAIPHANQMFYQSKNQKQETELLEIKAAVADMLHLSATGQLVSIGPIDDLGQVHTKDTVPLVLADFLPDGTGRYVTSGYKYSFTADGVVVQTKE
jgi:hypothetical protein